MAVKNVAGHGVTSVLGKSDHAVAYGAQPSFQGGGGMTNSQAHVGPNANAYSGGRQAAQGADVGAYGTPAGSKKNSQFPPSR